MTKVDLTLYQEFVKEITSPASNNTDAFIGRTQDLADQGLNVPLLLTGAIGLASEGGEFAEIVKKIVFQGKPYTEDNRWHMKRELGDIAWYWVNACRALGYDPNEIIVENVKKLKNRYPSGEFNVSNSEIRQPNDL